MDQNELKMAIETEKKIRLTREQYDDVLSGLNELGAEFIGEEFEVNELYNGGKIERDKAVLRVRKIDKKTILTYKKQVRNEFGIKQHTEYETEVSDAEAIENIIKCLGFYMSLVYEKRRKTFHFRNVEIVLDELPFGLFMEIEGKITEIGMIEMLLGIEDFEAENDTYPILTLKLGVKKGGVIEARFN